MRHIIPQLCVQFFCISLFLIFNSTAAAQILPTPGIRSDIPNREWTLNQPKTGLQRTLSAEREARILQMTLRDDFRQLQIINNELMERTFGQGRNSSVLIGTANKEIRSSLGEMHKRADRLKTNLRLFEAKTRRDKTNEDGLSYSTTSLGLIILDQTIMKFVENPIFQRPGVVDVQLSLQASEDLNNILRLTESLRKLAKKSPAQLAQQAPGK